MYYLLQQFHDNQDNFQVQIDYWVFPGKIMVIELFPKIKVTGRFDPDNQSANN